MMFFAPFFELRCGLFLPLVAPWTLSEFWTSIEPSISVELEMSLRASTWTFIQRPICRPFDARQCGQYSTPHVVRP
ncbi:hypothetical protein DFH27DRAFT_573651 [Peziza echinospora]|nr:hypothetical protein DFH27DRAFT_573651 [Peziza echinospora]